MSTQPIMMLAVGVILVHCVCVVAALSRRRWAARKVRLAGFSASIALMAGGAAGLLLSFPAAPLLLAAGVAGSFVFDRRGSC